MSASCRETDVNDDKNITEVCSNDTHSGVMKILWIHIIIYHSIAPRNIFLASLKTEIYTK